MAFNILHGYLFRQAETSLELGKKVRERLTDTERENRDSERGRHLETRNRGALRETGKETQTDTEQDKSAGFW